MKTPAEQVLRAAEKYPAADVKVPDIRQLDAAFAELEARSLFRRKPLTRAEAMVIAQQWYSVVTWSGPGVCMYALGSTGRVQSAKHREDLLAYIDALLTRRMQRRDFTELTELRAWVQAEQLH